MQNNRDADLDRATRQFAAKLAARAAEFAKLTRIQKDLFSGNTPEPHSVAQWLAGAAKVTSDVELEEVRTKLAEAWTRLVSVAFMQLEADLRETCSANGWRMDGQWPDFVINLGVAVRLVEAERMAIVGGTRCPASVPAIKAALDPLISTLVPKSFSSKQFMEVLLRAYEASTSSKRGQARIFDVYRNFVIESQTTKFWRDARLTVFTPLSVDQFRARLSTALEDGITRIDNFELRMLPPLDPKDALFIYQPADRRFGYVGRIEFIK